MVLRSLRFGIAVPLLFFFGCDEEASPQEKCESFYDVVCDRTIECSGSSVPSGAKQTCLDALEMSMSCSEAIGVSDSFDECLDAYETADCNVLFPINPSTNKRTAALPSSCVGSIKK